MIKLTPRDWFLMEEIYSNTMMSFCQISKYVFYERAKSTIHNRLTQLELGGVLRRFKMGRIIHHLHEREIGVVFSLTKLGLNLLQIKLNDQIIRTEPVPINTSTIYHDLLLVDVTKKLKKTLPHMNFFSGKLLNFDKTRRQRLPDIIAKEKDCNTKFAIELELTAKSDKRYRQIITEYRLNQEFEKILYVTANLTIEEKIKSVLTHKKVDGFMRPSTGKFYFVSLQDLIDDDKNFQLTNGADVICAQKEFQYVSTI